MKEVLLRENIENLGLRGEIVNVADGYARNYLLPKNLVLPVTKSHQRQIERERAAAEAITAEERQAADAVAVRSSALECVVARKVGEKETLYGSVTTSDLAAFLASQQIEIDKRKIKLSEPLKELGQSTVSVKLHRDVTAQLKVRIIKEEAAGVAASEADVAEETNT